MNWQGYKISAAIAALMLVVTVTGCKPTEQNYKAAYDAALQKRAQVAAEQMRPATGLLSDEGPQLRVVEGDSVFVTREMLRTLDGKRPGGKWAVAVGVFKIDTNAKASAEDLKPHEFPHAFAAKSTGAKYYAVADTVQTLDQARETAKRFKKSFPQYPYVGLPGAPVLINF